MYKDKCVIITHLSFLFKENNMFNFTKLQQIAYDAIMSGQNVCITGSGGVGKSYIIQKIREQIEEETLFVAPTGIAAVNIGGATIHKTFGLNTGIQFNTPSINDKIKDVLANEKLKRLVIDEISMVRADTFSVIDKILKFVRKNKAPFGGLQVVVIGDFYQLPPILTSKEKVPFSTKYDSIFCFATSAWKNANFTVVDLKESMRQFDKDFIDMLNNIRVGSKDAVKALEKINHIGLSQTNIDESWIMLTATNAVANDYNSEMYDALDDSEEIVFYAQRENSNVKINPVDDVIRLKKGAHIIIKANDINGLYVNGDRGVVDEVIKDGVFVTLLDGRKVFVTSYTWEEKEYVSDSEGFRLTTIGTFKQIPIKYGWAITIHSSQGLTLDGAILNTGRGCFTDGQLYVALSRIKSLEKFCLIQPIRNSELMTSKEVQKFYAQNEISILNMF